MMINKKAASYFVLTVVAVAVLIGVVNGLLKKEKGGQGTQSSPTDVMSQVRSLVRKISERGAVASDAEFQTAALELVRMGKAAVPQLLKLLRDDERKLREPASWQFTRMTGFVVPQAQKQDVEENEWIAAIVAEYERWWRENSGKPRWEWMRASISGDGATPGEHEATTQWRAAIGLNAFSYLVEAYGLRERARARLPWLPGLYRDVLGGAVERNLKDPEKRKAVGENAAAILKEGGVE